MAALQLSATGGLLCWHCHTQREVDAHQRASRALPAAARSDRRRRLERPIWHYAGLGLVIALMIPVVLLGLVWLMVTLQKLNGVTC
jgi:hypothetical protein